MQDSGDDICTPFHAPPEKACPNFFIRGFLQPRNSFQELIYFLLKGFALKPQRLPR